MKAVTAMWQGRGVGARLLWPLSLLFALMVTIRRFGYRHRWWSSRPCPLPLVVVGNLTVGGSGKTPLVVWLCHLFLSRGLRPGVVSRGYGGNATHWPQTVTPSSDPRAVGDEPLLIASATGCPVVVAPDRVAAIVQLMAEQKVDLIISDDGLQHYRMERDLELVVVDGERRFGNGWLLPAGPLREPLSRLDEVDLIVANGRAAPGEYAMTLVGERLVNLIHGGEIPLNDLLGKTVVAVAAIGHPERFFRQLERAGVTVIRTYFEDHHPFNEADISPLLAQGTIIVMTEKDAVKWRPWLTKMGEEGERIWSLPVSAELPQPFTERLLHLLERNHGLKTTGNTGLPPL
ncbi:MAG: tetraacyldisaccharide 4'-kinase [Gammaproteobacteria bacterium]|nr:tetraacyldisaccharide 4'-kinase [Gammaproteobacteria bacterium]